MLKSARDVRKNCARGSASRCLDLFDERLAGEAGLQERAFLQSGSHELSIRYVNDPKIKLRK
jgi:hypothetical protein